MAYITAQEVKSIRQALKAEFGKNFKFGVRRQHGSSVDITVKSGIAPLDTWETENARGDKIACNGHFQVNHYHTHFYGEFQGFFDRISEIAHTAPGMAGGKKYYCNDDTSSDYFDRAYYVHINVGEWNKPYVKTS